MTFKRNVIFFAIILAVMVEIQKKKKQKKNELFRINDDIDNAQYEMHQINIK